MEVWRLTVKSANYCSISANGTNHRTNGRLSRVVHSQSHGCTLADVFSPLFWVLFTQPLLDSFLIRREAVKEANTFQGESKNHSPLLETHLRLKKSYYSVSAIVVFYIYDYFSMSVFVFLFIVQVSKVMSVQAFWKMLCLCACLPQWSSSYSPDVHWCVFLLLSLPSRRDSLSVLTLYPSPKCAVTCLSVTPLRSSSLSLFPRIYVRNCGLSRCQLCISSVPEHLWHRLSLYCVQEAVPTQFYMQQNNATPRPSTPSSGCLTKFPFIEDENSFQPLFFSHSLQGGHF